MKVKEIKNLNEENIKFYLTPEMRKRLEKVNFTIDKFLTLYQEKVQNLNDEEEYFSIEEFITQIEELYS